jgi:hypothetical protein
MKNNELGWLDRKAPMLCNKLGTSMNFQIWRATAVFAGAA